MKISIYINKYNCLIFLDVILKYYKDYLDNDVIEWIKFLLNGSKSVFWDVLNITVQLFSYNLFRTENKMNHNFFRKWVSKNPLNILKSDKKVMILKESQNGEKNKHIQTI